MDSDTIKAELEDGLTRMLSEEESHRTQQWVDWLDEVHAHCTEM